jgi:arylsulfatase
MSELVEYEEGTPFPGTIGRTIDESSPAWPAPNRAPEGSPNVVVFVLDDVGFGQYMVARSRCSGRGNA